MGRNKVAIGERKRETGRDCSGKPARDSCVFIE